MSSKKSIIGWREWVGLPDWGVEQIKAKIDTGARTSALHAFNVEPIQIDGALHVQFGVHPLQDASTPQIVAQAKVIDKRPVTSSSGQTTERYVVETTLWIGEWKYPIELTLTNRDEMGFRMLLGRQAIRDKFLVQSNKSFLMKKKPL